MKNFFYDAIYLIPLSIIPVLWCEPYSKSEIPALLAALIAIIISILGILLFHLKTNGKIILSAAVISVALAGFFICPQEIREKIFTDYIWAVYFVLIAVGGLVIGKIMCSFRIPRAILAGGLLIALIVVMFLKIGPVKPVVALVFFVALCELAEEIQINWKKSGEKDHKSHLVFISPFLILMFALIMLFPVSDKPFEWTLVKKMYRAAIESIEKLDNLFSDDSESDFGENFIGFSERTSIGGGVHDKEKTIMEIKFGTDSSRKVYITGKTFDSFDGATWNKTAKNKENDALIDSIETVYSVMNYSNDNFSDYCKYSIMNVRYLNVKTRRVFAPYKYALIGSDLDTINVKEEGGDLFFDKKKGYDDTYKVYYYRLNVDNPAFEEYLNSEHPDDEEMWYRAQRKFTMGNQSIDYQELLDYRERVKEIYLPETEVSPEVKAYMDELLDGADTDLEKLKRIEAALSSMKYSETPGILPSDIDTSEEFLDYFLLDKREGYCVYYATAFVLLARREGIPARYVQGYYVTGGKGVVVNVASNCSHAWPECYIDGVGWLAFEPTPGYRVTQIWQTADEYNQYYLDSRYGEGIKADNDSLLVEDEEGEKKNQVEVKYILIPIGIALGVVILLIGADILICALRYRALNEERRFIISYKRNMSLLKILGLRIKEGETLEEFYERGVKEIPWEMLSFIPIYESYLYRNSEIEGKETKMTETVNKELIKEIRKNGLRKRLGLLKYYIVMSHIR